jgi:hypothetical protein
METSTAAKLTRITCSFPRCNDYCEYFQAEQGWKTAKLGDPGVWGGTYVGLDERTPEAPVDDPDKWWNLCPKHKIYKDHIALIVAVLKANG